MFTIVLVYLRLLPDCFSLFDEGVLADVADRINRGTVLYREIFTYWNPGGFWLAAGMFRLTGTTVATLRISLAILGAAAAVLVWRLARDYAERGPALVAGVAAALICYPLWWMASSHWYATFAALAAALGLQRSIGARRALFARMATGLLCGTTFVVLQPVGVFVTGAVVAALAWDAAWTDSRRGAVRCVAQFALGALLPVLAMYAYCAAGGALPAMFYATLAWNLTHFRDAVHAPYGQVPFGTTKDLLLQASRATLMVLAPAVHAVAIARSGRCYLRHGVTTEDRRLFACAVVGVGLLAGNYYLPDLPHLAFASPPAFAVLVGMFSWAKADRMRWFARIATVLLAALALTSGMGSVRRQHMECSEQVMTPRGMIAVPASFATDLREVFGLVAERLLPGEPLFVYPYGPGYNFLTGHPNPTAYEYLFPNLPGFHTEAQYDDVVRALEQNQTRYVVVSLLFGGAMLQRYHTPIERYIRTHYRPIRESSLTSVWERSQ